MEQTQGNTPRVAVVGSGIAGLTCAHVLGPRFEVVLYEADERLGGHSNTVLVDDPDGTEIAVDTGFIVHNRRNYPNLVRLLDELEVATQPTEMSFGVTDRDAGLTYRATNPSTIFADRRNLGRPAMWRMLADIVRFWRNARRLLADGHGADDHGAEALTLGEFLDAGRYSPAFLEWHLRPMVSAIWSADPNGLEQAGALATLRFFDNHGILGLGDRPQWRTIVGGSRVYVDAIARRFDGKIRMGCPVRAVVRTPSGVDIVTDDGRETFDEVILACHTDQALRLLADPTPDERDILGAIGYQPNRAVLHTDVALLSPNRRAWAAWNYEVESGSTRAAVTYDLTALQRLPGAQRYLVTLNQEERIDPSRVIATFDYAHPVLDLGAVQAQRRLDRISGADRVHFCGAWARNGFHEDGMASALDVCARLGVRW
jgi:predicted NAD/FAD-binding protein